MTDDKQLPVPAWFNPKDILAQALEGKRTEDIANALGVTRETLCYYLRTRATEDWKETQVIRALRRYEEAEDAIDNANDMLELNKAREKLKSAQWILERVCRRIYGQDAPDEGREGINISINVGVQRPEDGRVVSVQSAGAPLEERPAVGHSTDKSTR